MHIREQLSLLALALALVRPANAGMGGGTYDLPLLATVSGGGTAAGGTFTAGALNLGGPSFSPVPPSGGAYTVAMGAAPAVIVLDSAQGDLASAHCYPVPFMPSRGDTVITFTGLTSSASVRIYTISGRLVRELSKSDFGSKLAWDARNSAGQQVASGVYIYVIKGGGHTATGKLMIIW